MPRSSASTGSVTPTVPVDARIDAMPSVPMAAAAGATALGTTRGLRPRTRLRSSGLDQKAAAETEWVTDDLRRIGIISAIMLAGLALAWVLLVVVGLGDFY